MRVQERLQLAHPTGGSTHALSLPQSGAPRSLVCVACWDYGAWSLGCQWTLLGSCGSRTVDPNARAGPQDHLVRHRLCSNVILMLSGWLGQTQAAGSERGPGGL